MQHIHFLQRVVLQIPLDGVKLHHRIADWGAGGKDNASAACDLVQVLRFHKEVAGLLRLGLRDAAHIPHLGRQKEVFEIMALVNEDAVNAQLLKGHKAVLAALIVQLGKSHFQRVLRPFKLLDRITLGLGALGLVDAVHDLVDLPLDDDLLTLGGHGDFLKLRVADDNGVIVAGGDPRTEFLAVLRFKILFCRHKDIRGGIELKPFRRPLFGDVVGNDDQRLGTQPQPLALHGRRHHLIGLASAHLMRKQGVPTVHDVRNGVDLVLSQGDLRIHTRKADMAPVILSGTNGIKGFVVDAAQALTPVNIFPYPFDEFRLYQLLPILGDGRFLFIENGLFVPVLIVHIVKDADVLLVQGLFQNVIGVDALGAVGCDSLDIAAVGVLICDVPLAGGGGAEDVNFVLPIIPRPEQLIHELLVDLCGYPVDADADADLPSSEVHRLHRLQRRNVGLYLFFLFSR